MLPNTITTGLIKVTTHNTILDTEEISISTVTLQIEQEKH